MKHPSLIAVLFAALHLPLPCRAQEVPLESFEWNPSVPNTWPQAGASGTTLSAGPLNYGNDWAVTQGTATSLARLVDTDAVVGAQSILITRGAAGTAGTPLQQTRLELTTTPPLADILPMYVDFYIRPTSWSGSTGLLYQLPATAAEGAQIFVDGHYFAFQHSFLNESLRLNYYDYVPNPGTPTWKPAAVSVPVPVWSRASSAEAAIAKDWMRFTVRVDPVTGLADVWLNGKLCITDAPRSSSYPDINSPLLRSPFYIQGSSNGPLGLDHLQATATNPLFGDMDTDGLPDAWELAHGLNTSLNDRDISSDTDTLTNLQELILGTRPDYDDTDDDGMADDWEVSWNSQALNPRFARDAYQDPDFDGVTNLQEFIGATDPLGYSTLPDNLVVYVTPYEADFFVNNPEYVEDGSYDYPFSTLAAAVSQVQLSPTGGTIAVIPRMGNYLKGSGNTELYLTASVPITIRGNGVTVCGSEPDQYGDPWPTYPGLIVVNGTVVIEDLNFLQCAGGSGAAIYAANSGYGPVSVTLRRCDFHDNMAADDGGAVRFFNLADGVIEECLFSGNTAGDKGGGFSAESCLLTIARSRFETNGATGDGGGIHTNACSGMMENCFVAWNYSSDDGGGAALKNDTTMELHFCTIVDNWAQTAGAGLYNSSNGTPINLSSSILWNNRRYSPGTVENGMQVVGWCLANYTTAQLQEIPGGTGNNASDPLFHPNGTFTLSANSPMIDTGDPVGPTIDLEGSPRISPDDGTLGDRGCFEFADGDGDGMADWWEAQYGTSFSTESAADRDTDADQDGYTNYEEWVARTNPNSYAYKPSGTVYYVDPVSGNDYNNGSFTSPLKTIGNAIGRGNYSTTIRICLRDGTYKGTGNKDLSTGAYMYGKKFYLKSINGKGRVTVDLENSGRFLTITHPGWDGSCGIEGITIRRGSVTGDGGAIIVSSTTTTSQPFIARCTLASCHASAEGGAVKVQTGCLFLYENEFFGNDANDGGAVAVGPLSSPNAVYGLGNTVAYNTAVNGGGGLYLTGQTCWKGGAVFNNVAAWGAGVYSTTASSPSTAAFTSGVSASCGTTPFFPASGAFFNSAFLVSWFSVNVRKRGMS